jgi:hypothetical protein
MVPASIDAWYRDLIHRVPGQTDPAAAVFYWKLPNWLVASGGALHL